LFHLGCAKNAASITAAPIIDQLSTSLDVIRHRNYNAVKAVLAGFSSSPIFRRAAPHNNCTACPPTATRARVLCFAFLTQCFRLKQTWDLLADKYTSMRQELEDLCSQQGNYKILRAKIAEDQELNRKAISDRSLTPSPIIPYLGMFLTDLTFGEEGNSDYVSTEHYPADSKVMFNMSKFALISKTILQLRSMTVGAYPFAFDNSYHQLLCNLQVKAAHYVILHFFDTGNDAHLLICR
jgi:hypothetical protein